MLLKRFFNYYYLNVSKLYLLKIKQNEIYEKKIEFSWVKTTEIYTKDQSKYFACHSSCILATFDP